MDPLYHSGQSLPETSGIYRITCTTTGKFYIGSSSNLQHRWTQHLYNFRNNIHGNPHMQNAFNKHGEKSFIFEVVELTLPAFQLEREQHWLDKLKPFNQKGFNINRTASKPSFSPETRERIRLAKLGHEVSPEARVKISVSKTGKKINIAPDDSRKKTLIITAPDGTVHVVTGLRKFCKDHNLDVSSLMRVAKGFDRGTACTQHKGYKARFPDTNELGTP